MVDILEANGGFAIESNTWSWAINSQSSIHNCGDIRNKAVFRFGDALDDNTQGGNRMVANGWKLTANKDEVSGEFWKASQDISGITNSQTSEQSIGEQWWPLPDLF